MAIPLIRPLGFAEFKKFASLGDRRPPSPGPDGGCLAKRHLAGHWCPKLSGNGKVWKLRKNWWKTDENWWKTDEHWCKASKSWSVWKTIDVVVFDGFSYTCKYCSKKMCREKRLQTCAFPFKPDMSIAICSSAVRLRTASNLLPRRWKSSRHLGNPWAGFAWFPSRANSGLWP